MHLEAHPVEAVVVQHVSAVEDECGLHHNLVELAVVVLLELVPLREHHDGVRTLHGLLRRRHEVELALVDGDVVVAILRDGILDLDLGVIDVDVGPVLHQHVADREGGRLADVARVLLEGEAEDGNLLLHDGVEERLDDARREARLLVVVHVDDLLPVAGHLFQAELLAYVDEVQDVLLEAGAAEADGRVEELRADARVRANGPGDLPDVGARALAEPGDGVNAAYTLRQHGVGHELGELRAPEVRGEDLLAGDPMRVDVHEDADGLLGLPADKHAVGRVQIPHGCALGQELRVGEDPEVVLLPGAGALLLGREDPVQRRGRLHRHRGLLDDDLAPVRVLRDGAPDALDETEVRGTPRSKALDFRGGVHGREDDVCRLYALLHVR
mmetsp:Transcript_142105/g.441898  ORF Transcript_142105/g.441898 Transcript_142105/m.441898 type:complete len:385 (-) Transcript_142105:296-1450(-)